MIFKSCYIPELIHFEENRVPVIVIENPKIATKLICDLLVQKRGEDGDSVFSENYKPYSIKKYVEIITDPFSINLNGRSIMTKTLKYLERVAGTELLQETNLMKSTMESYADSLIEMSDLPLFVKDSWFISPVVKAMGIAYEDESLTLCEKILEYMKLCRMLCDTKCFVLVNMKQFLSREEVKLIYKDLLREKISFLLLETSVTYSLECEKLRILDKDLCLI